MVKLTVCRDYTYQCLNRRCQSCGTHLLLQKILENLKSGMTSSVEWDVWEYTCTGKGKWKERRPHQGTLDGLIGCIVKLSETLARHIFVARWQYSQLRQVLATLPSNVAVCTFDFAENCLCKWQDEVARTHWGYNQITLHPVVCHYKCQKDSSMEEVIDYQVFLTADATKDAPMVQTILDRTIKYLQNCVIIIIIIAFKGAVRDFLQSPHNAVNCLQHVRSSGLGAIVCKSRATHLTLFTCKFHVTFHLVRRDSSAIKFDRVEITFI